MNGKLKILVLLVTLSLGFAMVSAPTTVYAGDDPGATGGFYLGYDNDVVGTLSDSTLDGEDDTDGNGGQEGDPDDTTGGFGASDRGELMLLGSDYDGEDLETLERWLRFLMLQVLPTP